MLVMTELVPCSDKKAKQLVFSVQDFIIPKKRYTTTEKELLAIVKALQHFRQLILGDKIIVKTDHKNLIFITNFQTNRAQRWKILLDEFGVEHEHIKGVENTGADFLYRCLIL